MDALTQKPWGYERLIELNDFYCVKEIFMKAGQRCSLQYHNFKHETVYIVRGILSLEFNGMVTVLTEGQSATLPSGTVHRMNAIEDTLYIESSTPEIDDVVRIEDDYGRN